MTADSLTPFLINSRTACSIAIGGFVAVPLMASGFSASAAVLNALPWSMLALSGFALNDYVDARKDEINHPSRLLPSKRISPRAMLSAGITLLVASVTLATQQRFGLWESVIFGGGAVGVTAYSAACLYVPVLKAPYAAILCSLPLAFDLTTIHLPPAYWLVAVGAVFFVTGRELLMDVHDMPGDAAAGMRTAAIVLGPTQCSKLAFGLIFLGAVVVLPLAWSRGLAFVVILTTAGCITTLIAARSWKRQTPAVQMRVIVAMWLPMIAALTLLLFRVG